MLKSYREAKIQFQIKYFSDLLKENKGNLTKSALYADIDRRTLQRALKRLRINRIDYTES